MKGAVDAKLYASERGDWTSTWKRMLFMRVLRIEDVCTRRELKEDC